MNIMSLNTIVGPVVVSEEEIAADLLELHEIYTAHERFLKVEHEAGVGHYVVLYGAWNLAEEILDRMAGRIHIHVAYGPARFTIYFRDHIHFQRTVAEVQLIARVQELEAKLAETEKRLSDYQWADPACRANGMG